MATQESKKKTLREGMLWDEWVRKYAKCVHCGKKGHIRPDCPLYLEAIASGALKKPEYKPKGGDPKRGDRRTPPKGGSPRRNFLKDPKAKAFLSAFKSLMYETDDSDDGEEEHKEDDAVEDNEENDHEDDEDLHGFLSMIGSLKD